MVIISLIYITFFTILAGCTSFWVSYVRSKTSVSFGDGGNEKLQRARSGHSMVIEPMIAFVPILVGLEHLGASANWIHSLGLIFLLTRLGHVFSALWIKKQPNLLRGLGVVGSVFVPIIGSLKLITLIFEAYFR